MCAYKCMYGVSVRGCDGVYVYVDVCVRFYIYLCVRGCVSVCV